MGTMMNEKDSKLFEAVKNGDTPVKIKRLIKAGANPNATMEKGSTPLIWAAYLGNAKIFNVLLSSGANANIADERGKTVREWAEHGGNAEIINALPLTNPAPISDNKIKVNNGVEPDFLGGFGPFIILLVVAKIAIAAAAFIFGILWSWPFVIIFLIWFFSSRK